MYDRDKAVSENLGLVHSCAKRFRGRGIEYDDLFCLFREFHGTDWELSLRLLMI